jgi:hypothetical protein
MKRNLALQLTNSERIQESHLMTEDLQFYLGKIRSDAAECLVLSSVASDGKREVFLRTAEHLNGLAAQLEKAIAKSQSDRAGPAEHAAPATDNGASVEVPAAPSQPAARYRRVLPWLLVIVLGAVSATLASATGPIQKWWSVGQTPHEAVSPQESSNQAMLLLFSGEQAERKLLSERLAALNGRLDGLESSLDDLKKVRAQAADPVNTQSIQPVAPPPVAEASPPAPEKPVATAENVSENPSPKPSEAAGPRGCNLFRSFDAKSGTYVTLDGRRRPCR